MKFAIKDLKANLNSVAVDCFGKLLESNKVDETYNMSDFVGVLNNALLVRTAHKLGLPKDRILKFVRDCVLESKSENILASNERGAIYEYLNTPELRKEKFFWSAVGAACRVVSLERAETLACVDAEDPAGAASRLVDKIEPVISSRLLKEMFQEFE